ncbi:hypothetical protein [Pelobium manganitolerans]|uniref:hypothetical protein n=1 Tax=Pelobium manganitolerans TaxID=1842495 RepID=UPI000E751A35|nr:hypothetical protein [Pelobium manganitolerans]
MHNAYFARVKYLTVIFSVYVLLLSAMPCNAKNDCDNIKHHSKEQTTNCCSPFFACNACAGFVFTKQNFTLNHPVKPLEKRCGEYHCNSVSEFQQSIWQPPKIS